MRTYEVLFILSPQVPEEEATTLVNDFKGVAEKVGASLKTEEPWGRRRLAYPIEKFNEGHYHLFVFESEGSLSELDRRMKNSDRILRHMIVRTDLDHKRAEKLAKRNPKKERVRPMPAALSTAPSSVSTPSAVPAAAAEPAPEALSAAPPEAPASAVVAAPEASIPAAVPEEPAANEAATPAGEPAPSDETVSTTATE